jgi:hypothetical protein
MTQSITAPDRMTRIEAAAYLTLKGYPIAVKTLAMYASRGHVEGPPYSLANGRVIYERSDLDAWAAARTTPKATTRAQHQDNARRMELAA